MGATPDQRKRDRSDVDIAAGSCRRLTTTRIESYTRWECAQSEQVAQSHNSVETALLEIDTAAGSNHGPASARDVPSHAEPGSEFIMVAIKDRSNLLSDLDESKVWIKVPDQIVGFFDDSVDLIPKSQINCNLRSSPPIVLKV